MDHLLHTDFAVMAITTQSNAWLNPGLKGENLQSQTEVRQIVILTP
jgi:hypothetical protein